MKARTPRAPKKQPSHIVTQRIIGLCPKCDRYITGKMHIWPDCSWCCDACCPECKKKPLPVEKRKGTK